MLLREKDKKRLCDIFSSVDEPYEIWAYGSRVNGTAHAGSDLDLVIRGVNLKEVPREVLTLLKQKITDSNIPILVDLFEWTSLPLSFQKNIMEEHEILFDNSSVVH